MPLTFIDIETQKSWRIGVLFIVLLFVYFCLIPIDRIHADFQGMQFFGEIGRFDATHPTQLEGAHRNQLGMLDDRAAVFLDDFHGNVAAAERLGMRGILVEEDYRPAMQALRRLIS